MTDRLEHHLAADHELDRLAELPRRRGGERTMRPRPQLAAETRANEPGDDADVLLRQPEHLREHAPEVEDPLRPLVQGQRRAIPDRGRRVQLEGVVRLGRRDIGLVELDRRPGERGLGVAALALQALERAERGGNHVGLVVRFEIGVDVRLVLGTYVTRTASAAALAVSNVSATAERDVLAVVANDIVLERRATLVDDAFEPRPLDRAEDLSDVLAMKDRSHAGHFLGRGRVELDHAAVGDRRLDRNGIKHPGKVEVGGVLRPSAHLQRAIHARRAATDR